MAVKNSRSKKRKRDHVDGSKKSKLLLNERVEVRSEEDGFLGSWHPGIVIKFDKLKRHVRYDNILDDNGMDYVEVVNVTGALDGDINSSYVYTRGLIRPPPPTISFEGCELQFGLCVDANHEEAWWEGVIFDHCDRMKERRVFFPDLGDEMTIGIHQLRITQDWDEVTQVWERRGKWVFLELIEEFHRVSLVSVSAKQIWYDLRTKKDFDMIREWTLNVKFLWRDPVMKVIRDYLTVTLEEVLSRLDLPSTLLKETQELESVEPTANPDSIWEVDQANPLVVNSGSEFIDNTNFNCIGSPINAFDSELGKGDTPLKNGDSLNLSDTVQNYEKCNIDPFVGVEPDMHLMADSNMTFTEKEILVQEEPIPPIQEVLPELQKEASCHDAGEVVAGASSEKNGESGCSSCSGSNWNPLILSEVQFCPNAVTEYALGVHRSKARDEVLKHLAYLGWEIEWTSRYDGNQYRYRYKSPDKNGQKIYYSLVIVCNMLMDSMLSQKDQSMNNSTDDSHLSHVLNQSQKIQNIDILTPIVPPLVEDTHDPEFCPEAVVEYYSHASEMDMADKRKLILKARKHLLAVGWILTDPPPDNRRKGVLYTSPENRRFHSLYTACGFYIQESNPNMTISPKRKRKCLKNSKSNLLKFQSNGLPLRVLRSSKSVQQVSTPCPSHYKPQNVLSWLIDSNMVLPRSKVYYQAKGRNRALAEGRISRDGIRCTCCQTVHTLAGFEKHASSYRTSRPAASIHLEDGRSLLDCQIQIMEDYKTRESMEKPCNDLCQSENDYLCSVCHYGGDLILCDQCPSSFHKTCLGLEDIPDGDWFCPSCRCGMCGQSKIDGAEDGHFLTCIQCEHKYHVRCLRNRDLCKSRSDLENWFCGKDCEKIYAALHKLLGEPVSVGVGNLTWTLVKSITSESCDLDSTENEPLAENFSKLKVALSVMHECFEPLKEPFSSRDLMEDVIFSRWSKLNRLNFKGFYNVLLERNDELISVATVRVHGRKVAEVPLVGTRLQYRRHGMCRILMNELEKRLVQLGVERLVLPAVPSVLETWTGSFGFVKMTNLERSEFLDYTFLDFQGTMMCHKLLMKVPSPDSVLSIESQQKPQYAYSGSCIINFGNSSPVSELYQAEEIEKRGMMYLQMGDDTCAGKNDHLASDACDQVTMVKQPNQEEQQCQNGTSPEWLLEKQDDRFSGSFKFYRRRRLRKAHQ
ncbi:hypothetical protein TanjilG_30854 [Lupinus angustifolius]|uniref:PHD-type domain-containing protein n=1 Tax=Lupinus angustifolius TaxID=3871 RepID=A0A1J7H9H6_LUPAN|nr:PREDICTED: uncharacterized protein LOC109350262 [Lupinus angustifolius]OIW09535.1 hypothetical protein TanjilG_30854 [Lupinus angustifolius]